MTLSDTKRSVRKGNTKLSARSRNYCFTLNNYDKNIFDTLTQHFSENCKYIFGKEKGKKGTPHIQGFISFKNARSFASIKKILPKAHIEKAKGSVKQNFAYCSKEGNFITNIDFRTHKEKMRDDILEEEYKNIYWKPYQLLILEGLKKKPHPRRITWIWETKGNVGKSFLVKYLALTRKVIIASGKKDDVFNQVNNAIENKAMPEIILIDIPRSALNYFNYSAIEAIKSGCLYSGKYEGGICLFKRPHIIIFANSPPEKENMSKDMWEILKIEKDRLVFDEDEEE